MGRAVKRSVRTAIASARNAERRLAQFQRLTDMSASELTATLSGNPAEAADWIRSAAAHGVVEAQVRLAAILLDGIGVQEDKRAALRWFLRAAQGGQADAMNMAGRCYENGWGAVTDEARAAYWYKRAADAGHDWGRYNYAHMLFDGRGGMPCDRAAAFGLYYLAASQGHARAMNLLGRCLEAGWGTVPDRKAAGIWYQRSAEAGYYRAQFNHAISLLERGEVDDAQNWFVKAASAGDAVMACHVQTALAALGQYQDRAGPNLVGRI
jgi:TPR repeat protein